VSDRIRAARIQGTAKRHAQWRELNAAERGAAAGELREVAGGRTDLLAEVAGILEGAHEGEPDEPVARQAAQLLRDAGADPAAIPAWAAEGRRRRADSGRPPFSGGVRPDLGLALRGLRAGRRALVVEVPAPGPGDPVPRQDVAGAPRADAGLLGSRKVRPPGPGRPRRRLLPAGLPAAVTALRLFGHEVAMLVGAVDEDGNLGYPAASPARQPQLVHLGGTPGA
jgi:hypothetical protein